MSLFDPPKNRNVVEDYPEGAPFWLVWAEYNGLIDTQYGRRPAATILVKSDVDGKPDDDEEHTYSVFGTLAEQVETMEDGELPAKVRIMKDGKRSVWMPA